MTTHWLLAVGFAGMAVAIFFLGWSARIMRVEWRDDRALRAAEARYERHTHRKGDPLPVAGRLPVDQQTDVRPGIKGQDDPDYSPAAPPWLFAGESEQGWAAGAAEYELLHQRCPDCDQTECRCGPGPEDYAAMGMTEHVPGVDTPSDFTRRMALDMDLFIKKMVEQSNYDQHVMRAD